MSTHNDRPVWANWYIGCAVVTTKVKKLIGIYFLGQIWDLHVFVIFI